MFAAINGFYRQRDDSLQRGVGISFGQQDPGYITELLRQGNIGDVCHCPKLAAACDTVVLADFLQLGDRCAHSPWYREDARH
jgi:hypothetical protein